MLIEEGLNCKEPGSMESPGALFKCGFGGRSESLHFSWWDHTSSIGVLENTREVEISPAGVGERLPGAWGFEIALSVETGWAGE